MTKSLVLTVVCLMFASIAVSNPSPNATKKDKPAVSKMQKMRGAGEDANVKNASEKNVAGKAVAAPPWKSETKSRGTYAGCQLHVDNRTPYLIQIFEDGDFVGTVSPWGDSYGLMADHTKLYARAVFDDGSILFWGPSDEQCFSAVHTWTLTP